MSSRIFQLRKWSNGAFSAGVSDRRTQEYLFVEGDGRSRARVVKLADQAFLQSTSRGFANHKGIGRAVVTIRGISPDKGVMRRTTRRYQSGRHRVDEDHFTPKDFSRTSTWTNRLGRRTAHAQLAGRINTLTFYADDAPARRLIVTANDGIANGTLTLFRRIESPSGSTIYEGEHEVTTGLGSWTDDILDENGSVIGKREVHLDPSGRPNGDSLETYANGEIRIIHERREGDVGSRRVTIIAPDGSTSNGSSVTTGKASHTTTTSTDSDGNIIVTDQTWTDDDDGQGSTGYSETSVNGKVVERMSSHASGGEKSSTTVRDNGDGTYTVVTTMKSGGTKTTSRHTYDQETDQEVEDEQSGETEEEDDGEDSDEKDGGDGDASGGDDGETSSDTGEDGYSDYGGRNDEELGRLLGLMIRYGGFGGDREGDGDGVGRRKYESMLGGLTADALKKGGAGGGRDDSNLGDSLGAPVIDITLAYLGSYPGMGGHSEYDDPYNPKALVDFVRSNFSVGGYAAVDSVVEEAAASA